MRTIFIEQEISLDDPDEHHMTRGEIVELLTIRIPAGGNVEINFTPLPTYPGMSTMTARMHGFDVVQTGCFTQVYDDTDTVLWTPDSPVPDLWIWSAFQTA